MLRVHVRRGTECHESLKARCLRVRSLICLSEQGLEDICKRPVHRDAVLVDDGNDWVEAAIFVFPHNRSIYSTLLVEG